MSTLPNHPHIELVPRDTLVPNAANPRRHSDKQIAQIAASIDRFGFVVPIICDDDGLIVAGAGRWAAAGLRGITAVPVIRVRFLSEADRRAFALADNRIAELSDWDEDLLEAELGFLFEQDYDLDATGFGLADLDFTITGETGDAEPPVELPDPDADAVSRVGDL
jgi:ParB-like chromosome segregation protein Spo0J